LFLLLLLTLCYTGCRGRCKTINPFVYQLENISKSYAGKQVLSIDKLVIERGKIYGIIGPSGAGKSTLLRLLNLLEPPSSGNLLFNGVPVTNKSGKQVLELRRKMTMVFQRPVLFDTSVYNNVKYGLKARGYARKDITELVHKALDEVGLTEFVDRNARSLSGGEAQRIALARAMVLKPEVILLDEPTSNLDPANVAMIEKITGGLHKKQGTTVIMVTHNIFQAQRMSEEILLFFKGKLIERGTADQIFNHPRDERTDAFIKGVMIY